MIHLRGVCDAAVCAGLAVVLARFELGSALPSLQAVLESLGPAVGAEATPAQAEQLCAVVEHIAATPWGATLASWSTLQR